MDDEGSESQPPMVGQSRTKHREKNSTSRHEVRYERDFHACREKHI